MPPGHPSAVLPGQPPVDVRRSARRRKTVSAFWEGGTAVVAIPARFSKAEEEHWVRRMVERLEKSSARRGGRRSDTELMARALELSGRYLGGRAKPASVRWVTNQNSRWGSCTPSDRSIRLSHQLEGMPEWVVDYVLVHELAHLLVAGHTPEFWAAVAAYPRVAEAKAFLEGVSFAAARGLNGGTPES
ncbi:M48 family metallopeptidase [Sinomonas albida]|uniref:M48 family metallopeptidase n=1 Tax=Sinomonas albida TaxID=369942 RepID=UPI0010A8A448|nr:M48 family metallopeptidase [Sinomonas albida]